MSDKKPRRMSVEAPKAVPDEAFDDFVEGAGGARLTSVPPPPEEDDHELDGPPLSPSQLRAMKGGPGRKRKRVRRPWADVPKKTERMTLILQGDDKARLDWMSDRLDRPAQRILRQYVEKQLRADAEKLFRDLHPQAEIEEDDVT